MSLGGALHQKPEQPGRTGDGRGEAAPEAVSDEATLARHAQTVWGADDLLGQALARENMARAWKRVKANKGSAGVDGRTVQETGEYLKQAWPDIRARLLDGTYRPSAVRRVGIPKPGGGTRELGIPTAVDRLIQQALLQVLQPLIDSRFSEHSHGFQPGRSAQGAVLEAQQYVQAGYRVVVDLDLEKFFDRVNHDILMDRLAKRIADKRVLRLIRRYLQAGILAHGVLSERFEGTPQGGPLTPCTQKRTLSRIVSASGRRTRIERSRGSAGGAIGGRNRMPDRNAVIADDDFLDEQSHDVLAFQHAQPLGLGAQALEEFTQRVSESQVGSLVGQLGAQRVEFRLQPRLALAQLGHAPALLVQAQ
jgi:RNA-directed DNA polymerase